MMLFGSPSFYDPFEYPVFSVRQPQRQRREVYSPRQFFPGSLMRDFDGYVEYCPCGCGRPVTREPARSNPVQIRRPRQQQRRRKHNAPLFTGNMDQAASSDDSMDESGAKMGQDEASLSSPGRRNLDRKSESEEFPQPVGGESPSNIAELETGSGSAAEPAEESNDVESGENLEYVEAESEEKIDSISEAVSNHESEGENANTDSNSDGCNGVDSTETNNDTKMDHEFRARQLQAIQKSLEQLNELRLKMDEFDGDRDSKEYLYLEEMLMRCLLSLDNVESHGNDEIRSARKEAVREIQSELKRLEKLVIAESSQ